MSEALERIPSATYRLQFHAGFTFRDALAILDYLHDLGISDIYASPFFQASPESTHGYDIANHNRLNPAIGDDSDFRAFVSGLRERDMGHVLDFVPNHMGIGQSLNTWWMAVLEDGIASPYSHYFDIDWHPGKEELDDKVLLPILGERYGKVLEKGEFKLNFEDGKFFLHYFETRLPLTPRSYLLIFRGVSERLDDARKEKLRAVAEALTQRESRDEAKERLREWMETDAPIRTAVNETLRFLEGEEGKPESFDALHELLEAQVYRLAYWRVAAEEINYRRFFDINTLAAIRVEIPEVFEAAHHFVFELLARGDVTGLRIDHIDGLWNPPAYLRRVQERYAQLTGGKLYLVVEKILDPTREQLPADWPVNGTTGYEFGNQAGSLFVDSANEKRMTRIYEQFTGMTETFGDLVYEKKSLTMENSLRSEITALGRMLDALSEMHRHFRDFSRNALTAAVQEVMACFPVYRTYVTEDGIPSPEDEKVILRAILAARRRNPSIEKAVFDFLRGILLLRLPDHLSQEQREAHVRFVMKFQQCSGPVTAKGLEDTAFYIYNRLIALNEVGSNPELFGIDVTEFHRLNLERQGRFPYTLLATSTHDTKRSEDARMRIAALSEIPHEWRGALRKWRRLNRKLHSEVAGESAPSPNEEYLLYQTLLGSWPLDSRQLPAYEERIRQYMMKALKEAKINSSWTEPNEEWENAVSLFVTRILDPKISADFLADFRLLAEKTAALGAVNSLAQTVLKCTVPGVPDIYQGMEVWDFSLVDPDNRRPVDYEMRREMLASLSGATPEGLLEDWRSGRIKLYISRHLLRLRRDHPDFFLHADYEPLEAVGAFNRHIVAFTRKWESGRLIVVIPRLTASLGQFPSGLTWGDTAVVLPDVGIVKNIFTGVSHSTGHRLPISELLGHFPVAVLFQRGP